MNFIETLRSVELVLATGEVPLVVGESGIGKTALAKKIAKENEWSLVVIDGNLLKEGEIGGLPTIESYRAIDSNGNQVEKKMTVYAVHNKLKEIDEEIASGKKVLLFIDEINRCEHTVQQELMNLILNREINGYRLHHNVKILAAMNPSSKYGSDFDYQVVDMDAAQENRFVWLNMESDHVQWIKWAVSAGIDPKVIEFISTFPEYLNRTNEDDVRATPRSYERVSKSYQVYKEQKDVFPRTVFLNVIKGNVGKVIAEEFMSFVESDCKPLMSYEDVFAGDVLSNAVIEQVKRESHTRLYLAAMNILKTLELNIKNNEEESAESIARFVAFLKAYPIDLMVGIMKDIKNSYTEVYKKALENEAFVESYFEAYGAIRG
ncbi:ATP-binding protein [Zhenhengia yiwuensis]|uniref:ATP-binding protein n=1 Tax=Zhenhengia yiwuensis TaxID=2763666 RepID=UPI002A759B0F|nr:ATP-binding protein [Zhenhengia yiwuensis]MDY3367103.1 ATP-binding protein [Zhenhengia yiwuensis]